MRISVLIAVLAATLLCAFDAHGQSRTEQVFDKLYPYSVAVEAGAIIFDGATSAGLKSKGYGEKTKLFRDPDGFYSAKQYYSFNAAFVGGKFALGYFFPRLRPYLTAINFGMTAAHAAAGAKNISLPRRQLRFTLQF